METHRTVTRSAVAGVAAAVFFLSAITASAAPASAEPGNRPPADERVVAPKAKSEHHRPKPGDSPRVIDVKFVAGTDVRVRTDHLVSLSGTDMTALHDLLDDFPGARVARLFDGASEKQHDRSRAQAAARSGRTHADLNLFFRMETPPGTDMGALVDALNRLDIVETAVPAPEPAPLPATASFVSRQGYRSAAGLGGIDADYAQTVTGGKGEHVAITDIEYSWNRTHEDLSRARVAGSAITNGTPCDPFAAEGAHSTDHGTAVLGEISGDANAFGVTGLAPGASLRTVNASSIWGGQCAWNIANAIIVAANSSSPGDVILIEQQMRGPRYTGTPEGTQFGLVPVEWERTGAVFAAIANATARGIIVVEAAGNGSQNLDDPIYNDRSGRNWFSYDSGAIMVGAGNAPGCQAGTAARARLAFSNHGTRLNVQAWGNCVMTTGYGAFQGGTNPNLWYTHGFGGTSSASPMVASSAAVLSSVAEARGTRLTPSTVRSMLIRTGQPQASGNAGSIGPLPNLRAALDALGPRLADGGRVLAGTRLGATTVAVQQSWRNLSGGNVQYEVYLATDGGAFVKQALSSPTTPSAVFSLPRNHSYRFAARGKDAAGIWGNWAYSAPFNVGEYQDNEPATNPAYAGRWVRSPWAPASGGHLTTSATAGSTARFTFTGSSVAWIATKAANRGRADVYVDGVRVRTVDLHSATTLPQSVVFTASWSTPATHTLEVRVVGTAGRPTVDVDSFIRLR